MPVRVLVVDDHELVAQGVTTLLEAQDDLTVVARAATAAEALEKAVAHEPDVVLMDYRLPDGDGVSASRAIRLVLPHAEFVMMTANTENAVVSDAVDAGFSGFVVKTAGIDELVSAVRSAAAGATHFPPAVLARLVRRRRPEPHPVETLSARELEVLQALAAGQGTSEIAAALFISPNTVRNHVRNVLTKLDAHSKLEAVVIAAKAGVIDFDGR